MSLSDRNNDIESGVPGSDAGVHRSAVASVALEYGRCWMTVVCLECPAKGYWRSQQMGEATSHTGMIGSDSHCLVMQERMPTMCVQLSAQLLPHPTLPFPTLHKQLQDKT
jgi:hypothetical protein